MAAYLGSLPVGMGFMGVRFIQRELRTSEASDIMLALEEI
jgi:hypothetical protein